MNTRLRYKFFALLCVVGLATWLWGTNYPFVGIYNANNNYLMLAAKNYMRFGFTKLGFLPTYFAGASLPTPIPYYLHHPTLIFPLSTLPFILFGFQNWVVHVTNLIFLLADVLLLYKIGELVWNKKVALWTAGLAMIFPMTGFFWKYIFFEQGSLCFNLLTLYFFIRYVKEQKIRHLLFIFIFSVLSGLMDWGVLYLFVPLLIFFSLPDKRHTFRAFAVYVAGMTVGLSVFIAQVYFVRGGFTDVLQAIHIRAVADELISLSFWPLRLGAITLIRTFLYFTPFACVAAWFVHRQLWNKLFTLQKQTLLFFLIFGLMNVIVLPTATWGHSYFLFYLIPYFSYIGALWFVTHEYREKRIFAWVLFIILVSVSVNYLKLQQVTKQFWKYDAAVSFSAGIAPYETVGTVNFPGDVLENYHLHPTQPMGPSEFTLWLMGEKYQAISQTVFACEGTCTTSELLSVVQFKKLAEVADFQSGNNTAWLVTKGGDLTGESSTERVSGSTTAVTKPTSPFMKIYRLIRDTLNVGQI